MTFCTHFENVIAKICGYRAIADLPYDKRGGLFKHDHHQSIVNGAVRISGEIVF